MSASRISRETAWATVIGTPLRRTMSWWDRPGGMKAPAAGPFISRGAAGSWSLSNCSLQMLGGDFEPGLKVDHWLSVVDWPGRRPGLGGARSTWSMTYAAIARLVTRAWNEEAVSAAIEKLVEPSRNEPGCLRYLSNRSFTDDCVVLLYEEYIDETAYKAHADSEQFARYGLGGAIPLLENREREFYAPLGGSAPEQGP
jgi:quinol monooxygenase YgiN